MQLTIRDTAKLLNVSERMIYRLLDEGQIPVCRIGNEVRFNRAELLEWATLRKLPISDKILKESANEGTLSAALEAGRIHHLTAAPEPAAVLRAIVLALDSTLLTDRDVLLDMLLARGWRALTPIGEGIAIPHVRQPAIMTVSRAIAALCFLEPPIDLRAHDGRPVDTCFFLVSPTARAHLRLLSRLAAALHEKNFRALLARRGNQEEIVRELQRIEIEG
ncbi:MAG: PTS sugar transporter subunit IIA [Elusimicrobia bacterium]|nr:PTS sugar transporter subunit IIA [Elusimicrobiota bacterium]